MITVVTGEPRSGTSLMMSVLKELGCDILGEKFPNEKRKDHKRMERARYLNPEGFWEVPRIVSAGARKKEWLDMLQGKTIKMICRAMLRTPREIVNEMDKVIFCARNPREVMQSQTKLVSSVMAVVKDEWKYTPEISKIDYTRYKASIGRYCLAANDAGLWDRTLVVDYYDMLFDTENQIKKICDHLELPYEYEVMYYKDGECFEEFIDNIKNASSLIRSDLYRSNMAKEYDKLALDLYRSIKEKKFDKVEKPIKKYIEKIRLKKIRWLDDTEFKTWVIGGWDLHRSLITNNKGVRDNLQATAKINSLPIRDCMHYNPTGEEYTIRRVKELPDLTRTKIKCKHSFFHRENVDNRPDEVTREVCYNCWQGYLIKRSQESLEQN